MRGTQTERFWANVQKSDACWLWRGAIGNHGYGIIDRFLAHRLSYKLHHGLIDQALTIDHLCKNKLCVNPSHLELVTLSINASRARKSLLEKPCKRGHPRTERNTIREKGGRVKCRVCALLRAAEYRAKNYLEIMSKQRARQGVKKPYLNLPT